MEIILMVNLKSICQNTAHAHTHTHTYVEIDTFRYRHIIVQERAIGQDIITGIYLK